MSLGTSCLLIYALNAQYVPIIIQSLIEQRSKKTISCSFGAYNHKEKKDTKEIQYQVMEGRVNEWARCWQGTGRWV